MYKEWNFNSRVVRDRDAFLERADKTLNIHLGEDFSSIKIICCTIYIVATDCQESRLHADYFPVHRAAYQPSAQSGKDY